jgi:pilus assembly protein CpaF
VINGHDCAEVLVGSSWRRVEAGFADSESLDAAARLLIAMGGRQIDLAHPFANVDIDGKLRVHALLASPVNIKTHISIRVHAARQVALEQLVQIKMLSADQLKLLREILRSRQSFLISGAAGSGKTTLLRAMLGELTAERIITIEDVAELQLESTSCVSLCSREANVEGKGAISLQQLLLESLRMRPDRLVIGEVRSGELITLMQAINSGHSACATIHANSADQVRERIIGIAVAAGLGGADTWQQFSQSIDWLIHIENRSGSRAVELRRLNE